MKSWVLNFFLLILEILLNLSLNTSHKGNRFFKILLEKSLKFILNRRDGTVIFNSSFILLLIKINPI